MNNYISQLLDEYAVYTLSMEEYCNTIPGGNEYRHYLVDTKNQKTVVHSGMFKWPDGENPENWAGPFPGNYVGFKLFDFTGEKLLTPVEIHKRNVHRVEHNCYYYGESVLTRLGWGRDSGYWNVVVGGETCSRSEMTDAELILVYAEMTPEERMDSDIRKAQYIGARGEESPYNQISTLNPYRMYLFGNDDCSHSCYFNEDTAFNAIYILSNPSWHIMDKFVFTN